MRNGRNVEYVYGIPPVKEDEELPDDVINFAARSSGYNHMSEDCYHGLLKVLREDKDFIRKMGDGNRQYVGVEVWFFGDKGGNYVGRGPLKIMRKDNKGHESATDFDSDVDAYDVLNQVMREAASGESYDTTLRKVVENLSPRKSMEVSKSFNESFITRMMPALSQISQDDYGMEMDSSLVRFIGYRDSDGSKERESISIWSEPDSDKPKISDYSIVCKKY